MKKITFDETTIAEITSFAENHGLMETCNRFTLKPDTMKRISREYNFSFNGKKYDPESAVANIPAETIEIVRNLYENTNMDLHSIQQEVNIRYTLLLDILAVYYTEEYRNNRKSKLYRLSKLGDKNPMLGKTGELHPNYKGIVEDGKGYLMCLKPDWYTGRKGSIHIYVHNLVMCEALGLTEMPKGWVVHHIDGNKHNNDISNLALITVSGHGRLHSIQRNLCKVQRSEINRREDVPETPNNG